MPWANQHRNEFVLVHRGDGSTDSSALRAESDVTRMGHESIGRLVRRARVEAGLTQRALAARSGVNQAVISRLENGKQHGMSWRRFGRLVGTLGGLDARVRMPPRSAAWATRPADAEADAPA